MPTKMLINLAKHRKMYLDKVEEYWDRAKEIAAKKFDETDPQFYPYVNGIVHRMCGYSAKAVKGRNESDSGNSDIDLPPRVQLAVNRQIYKVIKPLFIKITTGQRLPRGMACHSLSFKYLLEKASPRCKIVMLYRYNTVNRHASLLAHSVVCLGNKIVFDTLNSSVHEIVDNLYYESTTDSYLHVAVRLSLDAIEALIGEGE